jgi:hypothetical protein
MSSSAIGTRVRTFFGFLSFARHQIAHILLIVGGLSVVAIGLGQLMGATLLLKVAEVAGLLLGSLAVGAAFVYAAMRSLERLDGEVSDMKALYRYHQEKRKAAGA